MYIDNREYWDKLFIKSVAKATQKDQSIVSLLHVFRMEIVKIHVMNSCINAESLKVRFKWPNLSMRMMPVAIIPQQWVTILY